VGIKEDSFQSYRGQCGNSLVDRRRHRRIGSEILFGSEFGVPDPPLFALIGILIYGIMANVCFTGGWIAELVIRQIWPHEAERFASSVHFISNEAKQRLSSRKVTQRARVCAWSIRMKG